MKVNQILSNYTPTFKGSVVPYPEYGSNYGVSQINATRADAFSSDPLTALVNKFAKAFRLLFTPEITASSKQIKEGIDLLFDDPKIGKELNKLA